MLNQTATSISSGIDVSEFRNCILSIAGSGSANLRVFVKGAIRRVDTSYTAPNFNIRASARDYRNNWDYVEAVDMEDGTAIDGDDGIGLSGNVIRNFEVNINSLDWLCVESTAITAGTVTVVGIFTTNE